MTHEELLAKIDYYLQPTIELTGDDKIKNSAIGFMKALRAVVELHKSNQVDNAIWCSECSKRFENSGYYESYPCSTIQAIEKELQ